MMKIFMMGFLLLTGCAGGDIWCTQKAGEVNNMTEREYDSYIRQCTKR